MRVLCWDCYAGASEDAMLAALLDAGADERALRTALYRLEGMPPFRLEVQRGVREGSSGTRIQLYAMHATDAQPMRSDPRSQRGPFSFEHDHEVMLQAVRDAERAALGDVEYMPTLGQLHEHPGLEADDVDEQIEEAPQPTWSIRQTLRMAENAALTDGAQRMVRDTLMLLERACAEAEGVPAREVRERQWLTLGDVLHIVGTAVCLELLHAVHIVCGPIRTSGLAAPARVLMTDALCIEDSAATQVGAIGAAILTASSTEHATLPMLRGQQAGYGVDGDQHTVRVWVGEQVHAAEPVVTPADTAGLCLVETTCPSLGKAAWAALAAQLLAEGAEDVWRVEAIDARDNRAEVITAQCLPAKAGGLAKLLAAHAGPGGVRVRRVQRA